MSGNKSKTLFERAKKILPGGVNRWPRRSKPLLGRALGVDRHIEIDYCGMAIAAGEIYLLTTDGVHEHVGGPAIAQSIAAEAPGSRRRSARYRGAGHGQWQP